MHKRPKRYICLVNAKLYNILLCLVHIFGSIVLYLITEGLWWTDRRTDGQRNTVLFIIYIMFLDEDLRLYIQYSILERKLNRSFHFCLDEFYEIVNNIVHNKLLFNIHYSSSEYMVLHRFSVIFLFALFLKMFVFLHLCWMCTYKVSYHLLYPCPWYIFLLINSLKYTSIICLTNMHVVF